MVNYGAITVRAVIYNSDSLLVVSNKWVPGYYVLPGGAMDPGESITEALEREIVEELGIKPKIGNLMAIHQIEDGGTLTAPSFIFHIINSDDYEDVDLSETTHGEDEIDEFKFTTDFSLVLPNEIIPLLDKVDENSYHGKTEIIISKNVNIN